MQQELSGELVQEIMDKLPDEITPKHLSALILTLVDRYAGEKKSEALSLFITTTIVYARASGFDDSMTAAILADTAKHLITEQPSKKVH